MASAKATIDHKTIREWVESKGGCPAQVKATGNHETGIIRIDFPGFSGQRSLEQISWEEFFHKFEDARLAFLYQDEDETRFNKLVSRDKVDLNKGDEESRSGNSSPFDLLKQDHDRIKKLFGEITSAAQIKETLPTIKHELELHTQVEETAFYPALKQRTEFRDLIKEAEAQHGLVKRLLTQLEGQHGTELERIFQALAANVELHVGQEETQIFPQVKQFEDGLDLNELGYKLKEAKEHLAGKIQRPDQSEHTSLWDMSVGELYDRARDLDVHCRSNMRKEELIAAIQNKGDDLGGLPKRQLIRKAKEFDIHGRTRMNKDELIRAIRDRQGTA